MYYGIKTGLNSAFVITAEVRAAIIEEDPTSAEVIKLFLRGRDLGRYHIAPATHWLIYTYHGIDIKRYPGIERHLSTFREELEKRATDQEWYELQQPQLAYVPAFEAPKILSVKFGVQAGFAYDDSGAYANNATSFVSPGSRWLTAVLNSSVCNICLMTLCPSVQNGYAQIFNFAIEQLPIVEPTEGDKRRLEELVDALQGLGGQGPQAAALEREVDEIVYRTYGLSAEEIAEIERWHAERRALLGAGKKRGNGKSEEEAE